MVPAFPALAHASKLALDFATDFMSQVECTVQATQQNANAQQAKVAAANSGTPESGDASTTLPDGTPATQFTVKPTGTDRRTVTQVRLQLVICMHVSVVFPKTLLRQIYGPCFALMNTLILLYCNAASQAVCQAVTVRQSMVSRDGIATNRPACR